MLFQGNLILIFFFTMIGIYSYSDFKEFQRVALTYIVLYSLMVLDVFNSYLTIFLSFVMLFFYFEILTKDEKKFQILINPFYKIVDTLYLAVSQYAFFPYLISVFLYNMVSHFESNMIIVILKITSVLFFVFTIIIVLHQKFIICTFTEMYKIFEIYPIQNVSFNQKLHEASEILTAIEDKMYFERHSYSFLSLKYILMVLKNKIRSYKGLKKLFIMTNSGRRFISNIFNESRGYSTIPMQLIRSLGIKRGYDCIIRRKIFEIIYSRLFFSGVEKMLKENNVVKVENMKEYYLYIYFHKVNTFLGGIRFSKFLNAFDMQGSDKNKIDIYDCSNEGIFIACMGLSKRADIISEDNIEYFTKPIKNAKLDLDKICDMVAKMMNKPFNNNYLE